MEITSGRAKYTALVAFVLSILFFGITFLLSLWSGSAAIFAVAWQILATAIIWLVLVFQFHQHNLAERERLDMVQLVKPDKDRAIFQADAERSRLFDAAQKRLAIFEKWFIPIFAGLLAIYEITMGLHLFRIASTYVTQQINQPLIGAVYMAAIAFVSFLISRYSLGTSSQWKPLKAGAGAMLAYALICFAIAIGLALAQFKIIVVLMVIRYFVPVLLIVLGAETALNIIFDIYRPRLPGQYSKAAFDSRLLGLISEPGGILRTAAGALDYQFGFKISQTWFYKLLEKAIIPLILFSATILYLLSCFVVVATDEQAIIEHLGRPVAREQGWTIGPGLHVKWPWPIDIAYTYPTKKIRQINIGFVPQADLNHRREALLWDVEHYKEEYNLLVATKAEGIYDKEGAVPVSLVRAAVPVQYRIKDLYAFIYNHKDSEKILEAICYRQLVRLAASARIESQTEQGGSKQDDSLLGGGRAAAAETLIERIQSDADITGLGIEITFLGLQGVHPPPKVAEDYQQVVASMQQKQALILVAFAERNKVLSLLAGSVEKADRLYGLAEEYLKIRAQGDEDATLRAAGNLDTAFAGASGDIFSKLNQAETYAFSRATSSRAAGERFADQIKAYRTANKIYIHRQRLAMLEEALQDIRKYVVIAEPNDTQVFIIDVEDKLTPSLYELAGMDEQKK